MSAANWSMTACETSRAFGGCSGESSPGRRPIHTVKRTSQVASSTGVTAEIVRLSIMPQLFVTATPRPALIAWTPLVTSSIDWAPPSSSKAIVKSTYDTGSSKSWRVNRGVIGTLWTYLKCAKSTPFSRTYCGCSSSRSSNSRPCGWAG
jgi:hypothetical protein